MMISIRRAATPFSCRIEATVGDALCRLWRMVRLGRSSKIDSKMGTGRFWKGSILAFHIEGG